MTFFFIVGDQNHRIVDTFSRPFHCVSEGFIVSLQLVDVTVQVIGVLLLLLQVTLKFLVSRVLGLKMRFFLGYRLFRRFGTLLCIFFETFLFLGRELQVLKLPRKAQRAHQSETV